MNNASFLDQMKQAALAAAREANRIRDTHQLASEYKPDRSTVTAADRASEVIIRDRLGALVQGARFLGEESEPEKGWNEWLKTPSAQKGSWWVVDPIDGTSNFDRNNGPWAVSVALQDKDVTRLAVVYRASAGNGHDGKLYWSERGKGAFVQDVAAGEPNGTPVRLRYHDRYPDAAAVDTPLYVGHFSEDMPGGQYTGQMIAGKIHSAISHAAEALAPEQTQYPARCACADALSVVEGTHSAYLHGVHYPWDGAAIYSIINEAGYPIREYDSPTQPGISGLLTASSDKLLAAADAAYRDASPASCLSANAQADKIIRALPQTHARQ